MSLGTALVVLVAGVTIAAAFFPKARVRTAAQVFSGLVACGASALTLARVVAAVKLESRGGGVLLLFAVVPGLVALVTWAMFFASRGYGALLRRPVDEQRRATLESFDGSLDAGLQRLARLRAQRAHVATTAARRAELDRAIAHEERILGLLPVLRPALDDVRSYEQEGAPTAARRR